MLKIYILGEFEVYVNNKKVDTFKSRKAVEVLKYLVLNRGRQVPLVEIYDLFWPGFEDEGARLNLNTTLYYIRKNLKLKSNELTLKENYCLFSKNEDIYIDMEEFIKLSDEGFKEKETTRRLFLFTKAVDLYKDDLLQENMEDEWIRDKREFLKRLYIDLLLEIGNIYMKMNNPIDAHYYIQKAFLNSQREDAWLKLVRYYVENSQLEKARSLFNEYKDYFGCKDDFSSFTMISQNNSFTNNIFVKNGSLLSLELFDIVLELEQNKRDKDFILVEIKINGKLTEDTINNFKTIIRKEDVFTIKNDNFLILLRGIKNISESREKVIKKITDFLSKKNIEFTIVKVE